jgi:Flp pilus assembly pilin Flp
MSKWHSKVGPFLQAEGGMELPEYAVMAALLIAAILTAIVSVSLAIGNAFFSMGSLIAS